jgi:hypothetical protein
MKYFAVLSSLVCMGSIAAAHAEAPSALARQHLEAIGGGEVAKITSQYTADSWLNWVGGPLDGTYVGPQRLAEVWGKFAKSQAPLKVTVGDMKESSNPAGTTVTANVVFAGKTTIKVRYVLLYRGDHLVDEIWQIDPKLPG